MRFLFVDRIVESIPGEYSRGIKHVTADDCFLSLDENGQVSFAASLIGECLGQLAAWNVMSLTDFTHRPIAGIANSVRIYGSANLGDTLVLESFIDSLDESSVQYHSIASVNGSIVFAVDGAIGPLLPMQQFICKETVKQQYAIINRPGDWLASKPSTLIEKTSPIIIPLSFDNILGFEPGQYIHAEKKISGSAAYFADHFPLKPVLPMTVLLECISNLTRLFLKRSAFKQQYVMHELRRIKMNDFVLPGDSVLCKLTVQHQDESQLLLRVRCEVQGRRVCVNEILLVA